MSDRLPGSSWDNPIRHGDWRIYVSDCPVRGAGFDYEYVHEQYDGPEDNRCGHAATIDACKAEIGEHEEEHGDHGG